MLPTLLNIVVGVVLWNWPSGVRNLEVSHHGLGCEVGYQ